MSKQEDGDVDDSGGSIEEYSIGGVKRNDIGEFTSMVVQKQSRITIPSGYLESHDINVGDEVTLVNMGDGVAVLPKDDLDTLQELRGKGSLCGDGD